MHTAVIPIHEILTLNATMYGFTFEGMDDTLARRQLQANANSLSWLLGHVAGTRYRATRLLGLTDQCPWGDLCDQSITEIDPSRLPSLADIRSAWDSISPRLMGQISQLGEAELASPLPGRFPTQEQTLLAGLSFLAMHEAYHVGQISTQRRLLGVDSLFDIAVRKMRFE